MKKEIKIIRNELLESFLELENSLSSFPTIKENSKKRIEYLEIDMCQQLMKAMKALEFHYGELVPEMRTKKRWNSSLKKADKLIKKYGTPIDSENLHKGFKLKTEFDSENYLENQEFIDGMEEKRPKLKKVI